MAMMLWCVATSRVLSPKVSSSNSGPAAICDVTDAACLDAVVKKYQIDAMFNLAALLSVVAEGKPQLAWKIGVDGLWNVLEVARQNGCSVFTPSSIACFGPETPADNTPPRHHPASSQHLWCHQGDH